MKISKEQLARWTKPWFQYQEEMAKEAGEKINSAIKNHHFLKFTPIRVFAKGSYANNTNVRENSDIDIAVEFTGLSTTAFSDGLTFDGLRLHRYTGTDKAVLKEFLREALVAEFGASSVDSSGNKIFSIKGSEKIHNTDVIPCTTFTHYHAKGKTIGIELIPNIADTIRPINYPDQHMENGISKNNNTKRRYKRAVRILKNVRNHLVDEYNKPEYPSFMIECMAYNISNYELDSEGDWRELISQVCQEAFDYLDNPEPPHEKHKWVEVSHHKKLFSDAQKWTRNDAKQFIAETFYLLNN